MHKRNMSTDACPNIFFILSTIFPAKYPSLNAKGWGEFTFSNSTPSFHEASPRQ